MAATTTSDGYLRMAFGIGLVWTLCRAQSIQAFPPLPSTPILLGLATLLTATLGFRMLMRKIDQFLSFPVF